MAVPIVESKEIQRAKRNIEGKPESRELNKSNYEDHKERTD